MKPIKQVALSFAFLMAGVMLNGCGAPEPDAGQESLNTAELGSTAETMAKAKPTAQDDGALGIGNADVDTIGSALLDTNKRCDVDSCHYADFTSNTNSSGTMVGYWISYHRTCSWTLGDNNNEHVYLNGSRYWDSADSGKPGIV